MRLSVLVPSYRRPRDLERCLGAIAAQQRPADQVIVVVRKGDTETLAVAMQAMSRVALEIVEVEQPGGVHALNTGLAHCQGDVVAITDDDAAPWPDWLAKINAYFEADPKVGAVGGRDWVHQNGGVERGEAQLVGRFLWFGRPVGNHHLGAGPAREVDFLKGVNTAFRTDAIRPVGYDIRLRGSGSQVCSDMLACLVLRRVGWKIIYDPSVAVDHFPAPRFDEDKRGKFDAVAAANRRYNFRFAVVTGLPAWRRPMALCWFHLIGTKSDPGLLRVLQMVLTKDRAGLSRNRAVQNMLAQKADG